jgi:uncharacterized protein
VIVGVCRFTLLVPGSHSLKEKRSVVRKVKDRVRTRFRLPLAEVGGLDTWQRAELGFALVGIDRDGVHEALAAVVAFVESLGDGEGEVVDVERDIFPYGVGHMGRDLEDEEAGDGVVREAAVPRALMVGDPDASWLPAEWREPESSGAAPAPEPAPDGGAPTRRGGKR